MKKILLAVFTAVICITTSVTPICAAKNEGVNVHAVHYYQNEKEITKLTESGEINCKVEFTPGREWTDNSLCIIHAAYRGNVLSDVSFDKLTAFSPDYGAVDYYRTATSGLPVSDDTTEVASFVWSADYKPFVKAKTIKKAASNDTRIYSAAVTIGEKTYEADIDNTNKTVTFNVDRIIYESSKSVVYEVSDEIYNSNITALAPSFVLGEGADIADREVPRDFTAPQTYTVTAEDGSSEEYLVLIETVGVYYDYCFDAKEGDPNTEIGIRRGVPGSAFSVSGADVTKLADDPDTANHSGEKAYRISKTGNESCNIAYNGNPNLPKWSPLKVICDYDVYFNSIDAAQFFVAFPVDATRNVKPTFYFAKSNTEGYVDIIPTRHSRTNLPNAGTARNWVTVCKIPLNTWTNIRMIFTNTQDGTYTDASGETKPIYKKGYSLYINNEHVYSGMLDIDPDMTNFDSWQNDAIRQLGFSLNSNFMGSGSASAKFDIYFKNMSLLFTK